MKLNNQVTELLLACYLLNNIMISLTINEMLPEENSGSHVKN